MDDRLQHEREVFDAALARDPLTRDGFLAEACAGDAALRARVEALLAAHEWSASLLPRSHPVTGGAAEPSGEAPPHSIGPYRLIEKLGEGGMGEVWLAEQSEPLRRSVALKIIKQGMSTSQVIARFEAERQALALMDHPGVAKVLDAGSTATGHPYFLMEYVSGMPITEHCDRNMLTIRQRLELFVLVCEGVQHAHRKAIIHRDLKPSNVLVSLHDGKAVPKIIDFGVAKALAQPLTARSLHTELGVLIGTPEYMSPEQADLNMQDVDTRSDVYSLGVMLYELLVGALPFESGELRSSGLDKILYTIREVVPRRPSSRLGALGQARSSAAAGRRRVDVRSLHRQLSGDLDWITMKALEKDRARRYGSPAELAADIQRHLADEPVLASPPSIAYTTRKFARRHRLGVAVTVAAALGLAAFAVTARVQASRIAREARAKARVTEFLTDLFKVSDPSETRAASVTARELLDRGVAKIQGSLTDEPDVQAELMATMASVYLSLGLYAQAEQLAKPALETRQHVLGPDHPGTLATMSDLANAYAGQTRYAEASVVLRQTAKARSRTLGPEHRDTLASMNDLANALIGEMRYQDAEVVIQKTLEVQERVLGAEHPDTLRSMNNLANMHSNQGRYAEAEALQHRILDARSRVLGADHPDTLKSMNNLAKAHADQGRHAEAEALHRQTLEIRKRVLGPEHPHTLRSMNNLAVALSDLGQYAQAEALLREGLDIQKRILGPEHPDALRSMNNVANALSRQGRHEEAQALHRATIEAKTRVLGPEHPETLTSMANLADAYANQGRHADAESLLREVHSLQQRVLGPGHPDTVETEKTLASVSQNQKGR